MWTGRKPPKGALNTFKAFTLVEVLVTLAVLGITFTVLFSAFVRASVFSYELVERSERRKEELLLFWEFQRALAGAKDLLVRDGRELFLITSGGERFKGVVKRAFIYREGVLYAYEYPYPAGSIDYYEEEELVEVGRFEEFELRALDSRGLHATYRGLPPLLLLKLKGRELTFKIK